MLDRAITLYVRWFVPIVIVLAVVAIPVTALQAIVAPHSAQAFTDMARVFSSASDPAASRAAAQALSRDNQTGPLTFLIIFIAAIARLLTWCALVSVVAAAYAGTRTTVAQAYRFAVGRWLPQLVVSLAFLVLGMVAAVPIFVLYLIVFLGAIGLSALHQTVAMVILLIVGGLLFLSLACTVGPLVFMSYELASVAAIVETANPVEAIGIGLRRAFAPGMKRRTVVAGLVLMLVSQAGTLPLIAVAAVASAATHVDALYFAILGAGGVLLEGIVSTFVVVYAVDARIRREGYDILAADTPAPVPA
ncbi:MAG: hypothetical protein QOD51_1085 [Candidatus Eremiobacteraeota bacterium]|nr:hypothetical protein [Candidatus Eremiobacteraeota bacterium]